MHIHLINSQQSVRIKFGKPSVNQSWILFRVLEKKKDQDTTHNSKCGGETDPNMMRG